MPSYESWVGIGCEFEPRKMLGRFIKKVPAETRVEKRFDRKTGEQVEDEVVVVEGEHEVVEILGKRFKLVEEYFPFEEVLEAIAGRVGAVYCRPGPCDADIRLGEDEVAHAFAFRKDRDREELSWILKHAGQKCEAMVGKLRDLGLRVGKPKLVHGVYEV